MNNLSLPLAMLQWTYLIVNHMVDEILLGFHFFVCSHVSFHWISLLRVSFVSEKKWGRGRKGKRKNESGYFGKGEV